MNTDSGRSSEQSYACASPVGYILSYEYAFWIYTRIVICVVFVSYRCVRTVRISWFVCIIVDRSFWQDEAQEALNRTLPDMAHLLFYAAYLMLIFYWYVSLAPSIEEARRR